MLSGTEIRCDFQGGAGTEDEFHGGLTLFSQGSGNGGKMIRSRAVNRRGRNPRRGKPRDEKP